MTSNRLIIEAIELESMALRVAIRSGLNLRKDASFLVLHRNNHGIRSTPMTGLWTWNGEALDMPLHEARMGATSGSGFLTNGNQPFAYWQVNQDFAVLLEKRDLASAGFKEETPVNIETALRQLFSELKGQMQNGTASTKTNKP